MLAPPDRRNEKPQAASAPKNTLLASPPRSAAVPSKTEAAAALPLPDRPQAASRPAKPAAQDSPKLDIAEPWPPSVETPVVAPPPPIAEPPPERVVTAPLRTEAAAPKIASRQRPISGQKESSERPPSPVAKPALASPPAPNQAPSDQAASSTAPRNSIALAPPTDMPEQPPVASLRPRSSGRLLKSFRRTAALPSAAASEQPHISVLRAGRRPGRTVRWHVPQRQRVAALPSGTAAARTASDAPSILVLRGARTPRYAALASAPTSPNEPLLVVIRDARPLIFRHYVQPNALILHIRH
jgi:hypothetical protein